MNSICFDTETTGLHPNGSDPDEILTISIIGRDGSVLLDERFRPTVKTEWPHASAVNGIGAAQRLGHHDRRLRRRSHTVHLHR